MQFKKEFNKIKSLLKEQNIFFFTPTKINLEEASEEVRMKILNTAKIRKDLDLGPKLRTKEERLNELYYNLSKSYDYEYIFYVKNSEKSGELIFQHNLFGKKRREIVFNIFREVFEDQLKWNMTESKAIVVKL